MNDSNKEIFVSTLTQSNLNIQPNYIKNTYKALFKVEGLIVEGSSIDDNLATILQSEHLGSSPAYFLKIELEKLPRTSKSPYKLSCALDSIECLYNDVRKNIPC